MRVAEITTVTPAVCEAMRRLLPQLSARSAPPDEAALERIVGAPTVRLLFAVDGEGAYVGMLSLVLTPLPTGVRARIEDVVVDAAARGHGAGTMLVTDAIRRAWAAGARDIDLTARPAHPGAVRLYTSLGFAPRDTGVYRLARDG